MLECAILQTWPPERNPSSPFLNRRIVLQKNHVLGGGRESWLRLQETDGPMHYVILKTRRKRSNLF
jgi:hypothetical protein